MQLLSLDCWFGLGLGDACENRFLFYGWAGGVGQVRLGWVVFFASASERAEHLW
jgi:hypothetical protein